MLAPLKDNETIAEAVHQRPDYPSETFISSHSFITEGGTRLTVDRRYNYYGNVIFARDWDRAGFMPI